MSLILSGWWFLATRLKNMTSSIGMISNSQYIYIYVYIYISILMGKSNSWQPFTTNQLDVDLGVGMEYPIHSLSHTWGVHPLFDLQGETPQLGGAPLNFHGHFLSRRPQRGPVDLRQGGRSNRLLGWSMEQTASQTAANFQIAMENHHLTMAKSM